MMLVRARPAARGASAPTAELENTYWKLVRLGNDSVTLGPEREPHFVLHSADNRVDHGGCNRIVGSYSIAGEQLSFSQMAGTMMACPDGMQYERAFHDALGKVSRWRIEGEKLELFDAAGRSLALFESRYMR